MRHVTIDRVLLLAAVIVLAAGAYYSHANNRIARRIERRQAIYFEANPEKLTDGQIADLKAINDEAGIK